MLRTGVVAELLLLLELALAPLPFSPPTPPPAPNRGMFWEGVRAEDNALCKF
jgi:hypothetical protein